ncbi:MAG TPA: hypothetical protein VMH31_15530 [Methylomirabilota bacterium]|nr:hypothetical protein [Methylomirabilota bacterium]
MNLRHWIVCIVVVALFSPGLALSQSAAGPPRLARPSPWDPSKLGETLLPDPVWVYNDWSSYDELSDNIPLTEELAMKELGEIVRLKKFGVHFDYYMMDAFWFDPDGGYRTWRKPNWPDGPDRWIATCRQNGLKPGLWFSTNTLVKINAAPQWKDSLNSKGGSMSFSDGGFLADFANVLQFWYDRGIRAFKFDFVDLDAATPANERSFSRDEIRQRNADAFREALKKFRSKNPDVLLVAFNGFGGDMESTAGPFPFRNPIDLRWLEVFDSVYSGDPRPSDVPETNFWRSMDIYSDHMVRRYEESGLPLERIDSTGMMVGNTGTIYYRKTNAWQGMLWGMMARGGWVNTIHGNLEFIDAEKARWFARAQQLFAALQAEGRTKTFGGIPGNVEPYGFASLDTAGAVYTVVNPSQAVQEIVLPKLSRIQSPLGAGEIIFRDAGFVPILRGDRLTLGPGQMAAVGFGRYATPAMDFGIQQDVVIPKSITTVAADFQLAGNNTIQAVISPPAHGDLRIVFQQRDEQGNITRSWPGGPPNGKSVATVLKISAEQNGRPLPIAISYDKLIWSGLSWGAGEIQAEKFAKSGPITIRCQSEEKAPLHLEAHVYSVTY